MKINNTSDGTNFKSALININAISDTHGRIELADNCYQTMIKYDTFEKEKRGVENYFLIGGDWFISGDKKGYKTNPNKQIWEFQAEMLNKFIETIKKKYPNTKTRFIAGNHEFDGGEENFISEIDKLNSKTIITNLDFENSKGMKKLIEEGKVVQSDVTFIQDDKKDDVFHPVLNLGIAPVNMNFYMPDLKKVGFTDNIKTPQKEVRREEYQKTEELTKGLIKDFKKKYPNGTVILTCHTGVNFADNMAEEGNIDVIFDGHEHKTQTRYVKNTPIIPLSQNFKHLSNTKIFIDDNGEKNIQTETFHPDEEIFDKKGELGKYQEEIFTEDMKPCFTVKSKVPLTLDGVRHENNNLANFVTDSILYEIKNKVKEVDVFALNSSAIRGEITTSKDETKNATNYEIMNCMDGLNDNAANILLTSVSGEELTYLVLDNFLFNEKDKEKNPLIQYSGIKINKTDFMKEYKKGKNLKELSNFITLSDTKEKINPNNTYKIANVEKYFIKTTNEKIKDMEKRSVALNLNAKDLFYQHFSSNPFLEVHPDNRIF